MRHSSHQERDTMTGSYRNPNGMTDLERQMATPFGKPSTFEVDQLRARIRALTAERDVAVAFRDAVIGELINCHLYTTEHETNSSKALHDAIMWNQTVALDPRVSEDARNLVTEGERRATAAIVADLSDVCGAWPRGTSHASILAGRYKRGDHLKPLDT